jgi:cell division septation protein DedD
MTNFKESQMKSHMRNLLLTLVSLSLVSYWAGCKASEETEQEEGVGEETMMKKDTAEVKVVAPSKAEPESGTQPAASTAMVFAVQVGAFESAENANRMEQSAKSRFSTMQVRKFYDQVTKLYKVAVGSFLTKDEALEFRKNLGVKYPGEYNDAWIIEVPK